MSISLIVYFLIALMSYLGSRKAGLSKGKSALVAAGATGLAYKYGVGDKVAGWFDSDTPTGVDLAGDGAGDVVSGGGTGGSWSSLPGVIKAAIGGGVAFTTATAGSKAVSFISKYWMWIAGGVGLYLLTKDDNKGATND